MPQQIATWEQIMSHDLQERSDQILHRGAYGWGLEMLCCVNKKTNINPHSGLLPPLGNIIPVRSLVTEAVEKAKLSHVVFVWSIQGFTLHERVSKLRSVLTCLWSSITTKEAIQYKGLNARLFIAQYACVIQSHYCSHCMWTFVRWTKANDIFMPVEIKVLDR